MALGKREIFSDRFEGRATNVCAVNATELSQVANFRQYRLKFVRVREISQGTLESIDFADSDGREIAF